MIKTMIAKYRGRCCESGAEILPGDEIQFDTVSRQAWLAEHGDCKRQATPERRGSDLLVIGGRSYIRNKRGRCIDAPCCGCCTI